MASLMSYNLTILSSTGLVTIGSTAGCPGNTITGPVTLQSNSGGVSLVANHITGPVDVTNTGGSAEFLTIYPGWYPGRAVHIHFKVRNDPASRQGYEFTSQLYFDESTTDQVHKEPPYNTKGRRTTTNEADFGFRRGGKQLMPTLTKDAQGYTAKFDIGLQIT